MFYQNEIENTINLTVQEELSFEALRFKELKEIIEDGYPTFSQIKEFNELKENFDYSEEPSFSQSFSDTFSDEMITKFEHEDRPNDDLLNKPYDGKEIQTKDYSLGKSISFSTPNLKWIRYPSPFNGSKEYNADIYRYCHECIDTRNIAKYTGFKGKRLTNYLQVWFECPEWIKNKPDMAQYLTCFLFGQIVQDYHDMVIENNPHHFGRSKKSTKDEFLQYEIEMYW